jgi:hypothetical protein
MAVTALSASIPIAFLRNLRKHEQLYCCGTGTNRTTPVYAPVDFQFCTSRSDVRQASACTVSVGFRAPDVPITDAPRMPRFASCDVWLEGSRSDRVALLSGNSAVAFQEPALHPANTLRRQDGITPDARYVSITRFTSSDGMSTAQRTRADRFSVGLVHETVWTALDGNGSLAVSLR